MASKTGFCGDGCSFDTVDIDCSMAFRMVESTIRRIMGGLKERKGNEVVFAGLIKSDDAVSVMVNSQHRSSKFLSSIPPQQAPPSNLFSSPQRPFSSSSSAPLLAQLRSIRRGLEELSLRGSPQAVSTPFPTPGKARKNTFHPEIYANTSPTPSPRRRLSSPEPLGIQAPAVLSPRDDISRDLRVRTKANTFSSSPETRHFCLRESSASCLQKRSTAVQLRHNQTCAFGPEKEETHPSPKRLENTTISHRDLIIDFLGSHQDPDLATREPFPSFAEHLREPSDIIPFLSYWSSLSSMASDSNDMQAQTGTAGRRTGTPPRSIFDDYQSAYRSILSPAQISTGTLNAAVVANTPEAFSELSPPNNPFADPPPFTHVRRTPSYDTPTGSVAASKERQTSRLPSSRKSRRRANFSRPLSGSPTPDQETRPARAVVRDSVSIFNLGSLRRVREDGSPNTKQPNLHGARGRVEKSSTIGGIVKKYGDESGSNRKSNDSYQEVELRSSFDVIGGGQGMLERSSAPLTSTPAGQAPTIPLPPDPSYVAARGLVGETLSEDSLYENTGKLLNLTQTSGTDALAEQKGSEKPYQASTDLRGGLDSEFSWMGTSGKASFRDLSAKELKQLRKPNQARLGDVPSKVVDSSAGDESYGEGYLLTNAVYQPSAAIQRSATLDEIVKADARRAEILSEHLATHPSTEEATGSGEPVDVDDENIQGSVYATRGPQKSAAPEYGGLQSSSSRGVSLESALRDGPFRPGLYMDESSLASLAGREDAEAARLSALAKGKNVIRSVEDDAEDNPFTDGNENEGGEWETLGETGMASRLHTQASIGRDTSGSSLANVSSNESTEDDRSAPVPWDPLRSHPAVTTTPTKAVIHQRSDFIAGVQGPETVPRYASLGSKGHLGNLNRAASSTPALTLSATPQYQSRRQNSPSYQHPTPLTHEHQNPFSSSPPSVDVQNPGVSYELSDLTNKRQSKRQAFHAEPSRSLQQQIHKPSPAKTHSRLTNQLATQDKSSDKSVDGSYSTTYPSNLAVDGTSILNPNSPHTPKSTKSFTRGSIKRTKTFLTGSPRRNMSESRRYQRVREEMGCGTGGIVRVPGMQQTAPPRAHIPDELIGPTKPYRAANPSPDLPPLNSFDLEINEPLKCPTFPLNSQLLQTFFRNNDGTTSSRPKAKRGTVTEKDGRIFEQAFCDLHHRWEFSHTPHLTRRIPKDDPKAQREVGRRLILLLFVSVVGWLLLVFFVAFDPGHVRDDLIREYSKGKVQTFHQKEIVLARMATGVVVAVVAVALVAVGVYL